jgi:hypothetical protein
MNMYRVPGTRYQLLSIIEQAKTASHRETHTPLGALRKMYKT